MTDTHETASAIFGRRLQALRQRARISQAELAELMTEQGQPLSQVTVGRLEAARRPVNVDELAALARIFKVTMAELVAPLDEQNAGSLEADVIDGIGAIEAVAAGRAQGGVANDTATRMAEIESAIEELRAFATQQLAESRKQLAESEKRVAELEKKIGGDDGVDKEA